MDESDYGFVDRMVHRLAFRSSAVQPMLCDLELRLYGDRIRQQVIEKPIFVTSLPRAGTTLLLEILSRHPSVVAHSYRDMPFVLSPMIWRKLSGRFRVTAEKQERAHSDGMLISADSAEAFEEVLWLNECPKHYATGGIRLWDETATTFQKPLSEHIRRLMASRDRPAGTTPRYLSKNNANIARLPALRQVFQDAHFVIPLRDPVDHAMSLHRQHMRFVDIHAESDFSRDYMGDIGHFEFGALHRPILFDGMTEAAGSYAPETLDYWLAYWICAHRHMAGLNGLLFVDMEGFTRDKPVLALLDALDLGADAETLAQAAAQIRPIKRYAPTDAGDAGLIQEARELHQDLRARASC